MNFLSPQMRRQVRIVKHMVIVSVIIQLVGFAVMSWVLLFVVFGLINILKGVGV